MILEEVEILRIIELRIKTTPISGTLCRVKDVITIRKAMEYFDIWNHHSYISHPYIELNSDIFQRMTRDLFRIFVEYTHEWVPMYTDKEIELMRIYGKKFGYTLTERNNFVFFRLRLS